MNTRDGVFLFVQGLFKKWGGSKVKFRTVPIVYCSKKTVVYVEGFFNSLIIKGKHE